MQDVSVAIEIRWMIRADMPEVLAIENDSFEDPWTEDEFIKVLRQSNVLGIVAECEKLIVGYYVIDQSANTRIDLLSLAVRIDCRNYGIGSGLINNIKQRLTPSRRRSLLAMIGEYNTRGQLFLKRNGFRATVVIPGYFDDGQDGYEMRYRLPLEVLKR